MAQRDLQKKEREGSSSLGTPRGRLQLLRRRNNKGKKRSEGGAARPPVPKKTPQEQATMEEGFFFAVDQGEKKGGEKKKVASRGPPKRALREGERDTFSLGGKGEKVFQQSCEEGRQREGSHQCLEEGREGIDKRRCGGKNRSTPPEDGKKSPGSRGGKRRKGGFEGAARGTRRQVLQEK